jgi:lipoprotein-anchoring transpeptidase ErfK/SrfK
MSPSTIVRRLSALGVATILVGALLPAGPASAQDAPGVTLKAARTLISFGQKVRLSGAIEPAAEGETVNIVDEDATVLATTTTDAAGHYALRLAPRRNVKVRAQWTAAFSDEIPLRVKPLLRAGLDHVRVFGKGRLHGSLLPAHGDGEVTYTLKRAGKEVGHGRIPVKNGRWFSTRVAIKKPGTYRAVVHFDDADHSPARQSSPSRTTSLPSLGIGSKGTMVKVLEKRLKKLHYHLDGVDRRYDYRTSDAVIAFNKVQGRTRTGSVDASTWKALGSPKIPRPVARKPRFHIEVDQTKQVVYMVKKGKVNGILHVSTGANGYTHDGVYHVYRKLAGTSGGGLYYPSYFDGLRALHGWSEVPTYNASHGCVRLPMWAAQWVFGKAKIGTEVRVYH